MVSILKEIYGETRYVPIKLPATEQYQKSYVCECGADKTYGEKEAEYLHSTWCVKYKRP